MHILNLGVLQTLCADAIIYLCENFIYGMGTLDEQLRHAFKAFKVWCFANRLGCTQRVFTCRSLHVSSGADYPFLSAKAFNCRIILAWVAES